MKWALLPFVNEATISENKASPAIHSTHLLRIYYVLGDGDIVGAGRGDTHISGLTQSLVEPRETDIEQIILQVIC